MTGNPKPARSLEDFGGGQQVLDVFGGSEADPPSR